MEVKFKKLSDTAFTPTRGSEYAAGWDLYSAEDRDIAILPGKTVKVSTDIAVALPEFTFGGIYARSGLATKEGLRPANCVGVVDEDYRGNIMVAVHNDSNETRHVSYGERIAQLIVQPYINFDFVEADELSDTARGIGGFGSSGK